MLAIYYRTSTKLKQKKVYQFNIFITLLTLFHIPFQDDNSFFIDLVAGAVKRTHANVMYDPSYFSIDYPNGDVPSDKGVCTDVIIRAYRFAGIDLQKEVHEDMVENYSLYPDAWELTRPDKNIDHRRVRNLMKFFERKGISKSITNNAVEYLPGDIVTWDLGSGIDHIGIVINKKSADGFRPLVVHNIGNEPEISDCLFQFRITGHYRYRK